MFLHEKIREFKGETTEKKKIRILDFLKEYFFIDGDEYASKALTEYTRIFFFAPYFRFWNKAGRINTLFLENYVSWLNSEIQFPDIVVHCRQENVTEGPSAGIRKFFLIK